MSDWTVHLEFAEGSSSKFWRARVEGKTLYVNYGKIGSNGQTQVKELADPAAAKAEYDKLVREKRKKGYEDAGAQGGGGGGDEDRGGDADDDAAEDKDEGDEDDDEPAPRAAKKPAKPAAAPAAKPAPAAPAASAPGASGVPGHRLVLDAGGRKVETTLHLDGNTVRMDSRETYASADAASKAFERLKRVLGGEGYKAG
ncbi:MAG TPA: WGR domain-containing protein [Kofleriaceae bacterium]